MKALKNVEEAAGLLGISKWTVRNYIKTGRLNPVRLGRRVLLTEDELERFIGLNQVLVGLNATGEETNNEVRQ